MILRYQMGAYKDGASWDALDLSVRLMQRLEPHAEVHVTHQGALHRRIDGVIYHAQTLPQGAPYCDGRHIPLRFDEAQHEAWLDNDHLMWALPTGWMRWHERDDAVLIWRSDWRYYGSYEDHVPKGWDASAGLWGLPPGVVMPAPVYRGAERNQDEYGFVVSWLSSQPRREYVWQHEVPIYCPGHNTLTNRIYIGTHGVHLNGLNRGWNPHGEVLLKQLRKWFLEDGNVETAPMLRHDGTLRLRSA